MKKEKENSSYTTMPDDGEKSPYELLIMHKAFCELTDSKKKKRREGENEDGKEN